MDDTRMPAAYVAPRVSDYGDLLSLTADGGAMLHVGIGGTSVLAAASAPATPGGGGGSAFGAQHVAGKGDVLGVPGATSGPGAGNGAESGALQTPAGHGGGGGGAGHGGGGGHGGGSELPFTGFAAALVGAVGAGLAATGVAVRRVLRRRES